jgi:hypothetical protein
VDALSRSSFTILPVIAVLRYNSAFPYGSNDGAVWPGRGLTWAIDLGVAFRVGPFSGTFNPFAFSAQNRAFRLQPNGSTTNPLADPLFLPLSIVHNDLERMRIRVSIQEKARSGSTCSE